MLEIKNLYKIFHRNQSDEKIIFENLSLNIKKGEFVTIVGGNGAGKSTLFGLIAGSVLSDSGRIFIDSKDITDLPENKRARFIGRVFQDPMKGTAPDLTIEENLSIAMLKSSRKNLRPAINGQNIRFFRDELAKLDMDLENRLKAKAGLLSGGQRQAVTLLMAIFVKPKILLLDEHTAALDPKSREKILELTEQITKDPEITTLMITHDMNNALNLGNRTVVFDRGKIVSDLRGAEREIIRHF